MFHSCVNSIVKIVFTPILLLFYLKYSNHPLPILAPIFVVMLLTTLPSKPPIKLLLQLFLILSLISFSMVFFVQMFSGTLMGYALFCWGVFTWSYHRSHSDPQDIISNLALIVLIIATVVSKQMNTPIDGLPQLIFQSYFLALVITLLAHFLLPGDQQDIKPDVEPKGVESRLGIAIFKSTAMCIVLAAIIGTGSSQSMIIALTISSMLKLPLQNHHRDYIHQRFVTTAVGILFSLPTMLLCAIGAPAWVAMGTAFFLGIQLACYAIRRQAHSTIYQLLFTNFVLISYQSINNFGIESFSSGFVRLISISVAIFIGALILTLINPRGKVMLAEDKLLDK